MQIRSVAIGSITQPLASMALGSSAQFAGFLAAGRNGRGVQFHVTAVEAAAS
jgi:primosomal replication protein N